jgi:hypothetical protein
MMDTPRNNPVVRFFRFRLRTLLLGILVLGLALGWKIERAKRQREAVAWVLQAGGKVRYAHEKTDACGYALPGEPPGPKWLRDLVGIDFLDNVSTVYLAGRPVSDLARLADVAGLKQLDLAGTPVADLGPLSGLKRLQSLDITNCSRVSDLAPLAELTELQTLYVNNLPGVTDFSPLAKLRKLQQLYAYNTPVSDLTPLAKLTSLRHIDLLDSRASDLTALRNLKNLRTLRFRGGLVSDLAPLTGLKYAEFTIWPGRDVQVPKELQGHVVRQ